MKTWMGKVAAGIFASLFLASGALAAPPAADFYHFSFSGSGNGGGTYKPAPEFPIFIFSGTPKGGPLKQIGFVAGPKSTFYYKPDNINTPNTFWFISATLNADKTSVESWTTGCYATVSGLTVQSTSCSGFSATEDDHKLGSNYYQLSLGNRQETLSQQYYPSSYYLPTTDRDRTVTIFNNTSYPYIQVTYTAEKAVTPYYIKQGKSLVFTYPSDESYGKLSTTSKSLRWVVTAFCTKAGSCDAPENKKPLKDQQANWTITGGYQSHLSPTDKRNYPYATAIEATFHKRKINSYGYYAIANSNVDISAVDGFNFKAMLLPEQPTYCTRQAPSQWGISNGVPYVVPASSSVPIASIPGKNTGQYPKGLTGTYPSLESICQYITEQPFVKGYDYTPSQSNPDMLVKDDSGKFLGCMAPHTYAEWLAAQKSNEMTNAKKAFFTEFGSDAVDAFSCAGAYNTKDKCDNGGKGLINNTSYVQLFDGASEDSNSVDLSKAWFKNIYDYQYDDPNANMGCSGETSYVVHIFDNTEGPSLAVFTAPTNVTVSDIQSTYATINWDAATAPDTRDITYKINVTQNGVSKYSIDDLPFGTTNYTIPGGKLVANTSYQVVVTAVDGAQTRPANPISFATKGGSTIKSMVAPQIISAKGVAANTAEVKWSEASDPSVGHKPITYSVNLYDSNAPDATIIQHRGGVLDTEVTFSDIVANATYYIQVVAEDCVPNNGYCVPNSAKSTLYKYVANDMPSYMIKAPSWIKTSDVTDTSATVSWGKAIDTFPAPKDLGYVVSYQRLMPNGGHVCVNGGEYPGCTAQKGQSVALSGLDKNAYYQVTVKAVDSENPFTGDASTQVAFQTGLQFTPPTDVKVTDITKTDATIKWQPAKMGDSPHDQMQYKVRVTQESGDYHTWDSSWQSGTSLKVSPNYTLSPNTTYSVVVIAKDTSHMGLTTSSAPGVPFTTKGGETHYSLTAPTGLSVNNIGQKTATVSFTQSEETPSAGANITYQAVATSSDGGATFSSGWTSSTSIDLTGLTAGKNYAVVITARDQAHGVSKPSAPKDFSTKEIHYALSAPTGLSVNNIGQKTATVSFTQSEETPSAGANITYQAVATSSDGGATFTSGWTSSTSIDLTGLSAGKNYAVVITARDQAHGVSKASAPKDFSTKEVHYALSAPTGLSVNNIGQNTATVSFTQSEETPSAGANITYQAVATSSDGGATFSSGWTSSTSIDLIGLTAGKNYAVVITARDQAHGVSKASAPKDFLTAAAPVSGKITAAVRSSDVTNNSAVLRLSADDTFKPAGDVTYSITVDPGDIKKTASGLSASVPLTGLRAGTDYTVSVVAKDSKHASLPATASTSFVTASDLRITNVRYTGFGTTAEIFFDRVGRAPVRYQAVATPADGGGKTLTSNTAFCRFTCEIKVSGLSRGAYNATVVATDSEGKRYVGSVSIPAGR